MKQRKGAGVRQQNVEELPAAKLFQMAEEKNEQMEYEEARFFYEKAYEKDAENDALVLCYAEFLKQNGEEVLAKQVLENSLKSNPNGNYKRYFQLAEIYDGVKSIEVFQKGIATAKGLNLKQYNMFRDIKLTEKELRRDIASAYAAIAQVCLTDLIEVKEAEAKCLEALKLGAEIDSTCSDVDLQCANYLLYRDDTDGARQKLLNIFNRVMEAKKKSELATEEQQNEEDTVSEEVRTQAAKFLIEVDCFKEAILLLTDLNETGKDQEVLYLLAYCNFKSQDYPECAAWVDEYQTLIKDGEQVDQQIAEAAFELKQQLGKLDPKLLEQQGQTGADGDDQDWMDIE